MHIRQLDSSHWKERIVIQHGTSWHAPSCLDGQHSRSGWEGWNLLHQWSHWYVFSLPSPMWLYIYLLHFIHVSEMISLLLFKKKHINCVKCMCLLLSFLSCMFLHNLVLRGEAASDLQVNGIICLRTCDRVSFGPYLGQIFFFKYHYTPLSEIPVLNYFSRCYMHTFSKISPFII